MNDTFYHIAPQMRDYLSSGHVHMPYVMHMNRPCVKSPFFSTDQYGFRTTLVNGKPISISEYSSTKYSGKRAALVGDSTSFGVGATSDANSITSLLNNQTHYTWFNFSGRTFESTQELILYLLYRPPDVEHIVILSGINNFDLAYRWFGDVHIFVPPYHLQNAYQNLMGAPSRNALIPNIKNVINGIIFRSRKTHLAKGTGTSPDDKRSFLPSIVRNALYFDEEKFSELLMDTSGITRSLERFNRDMKTWSDITQNGKKGHVTFILQPIAEWNNKPLSPEENALFAVIKQQRGDKWAQISSFLQGHEYFYRQAVKKICEENNIDFIDSNELICFKTNEWLFLDRYHLTDRGQKIMADIISNKIK